MVYRRGNEDSLNFTSLLFVVFALTLTVFSIAYAQWYSAKITGFVQQGFDQAPEPPPPSSSGGSDSPPEYVVAQVADSADQVSQSANYAKDIESVIAGDDGGIGEVVSEEDLIRYKEKIEGALKGSIYIYDGSSKIVSKFNSKELDEYSMSIVQDIDSIMEVLDEINARLASEVAERQKLQREEAIRVLAVEREVATSVEELESYVSEITPSGVEGEVYVEGEVVPEKCGYPTELASFDYAVNFGESGIDANGEICNVPKIEVYSPISISTSGGQGHSVVLVTPGPSTGSSVGSTGSRLIAASHIRRGEGSESANEAFVISKDKNDNFNINFISSLSFHHLEQEITELIDKILFGESDVDALEFSGMSIQESESIIESNRSVPWVLWIVLFVMIVLFLFFGQFLTPNYKKMILSSKTALDKGNYSKAIKIYNEMVDLYSSNDNHIIKQEILNYLILLRKKIGDDKISLNLPKDSGGLPRISNFFSIGGLTNKYGRVEKMILDALYEFERAPKVAIVRMSVVANAYKDLDSSSREKLAFLYESLVYKIRDFRSN